MKVIISHDVDHITAWEHGRDLILPKHIVRNCIEFGLKYISGREMARRFADIARNRWHNMEEMMGFDREMGIPSTFFFAVSNGMGLSYSLEDAKFWMNRAMDEGFDIGVHGIEFESPHGITVEFNTFARLTNITGFGIRMHYLRRNDGTLRNLAKAGYRFDSSIAELAPPFRVDSLWEFPLHIMDGNILCRNSRWQDRSLEQAKDSTKAIFDASFDRGIEYFTILLHDRYFTDSFRTWKNWYIWVTEFVKANGIGFTSYNEAIRQLERDVPPAINRKTVY
ncbi:MAG: hypothetical protein M0Z75_12655 [Nitrospiraceae bacterium]|nr:hypothetical protein [Nitrospiraceae bacterium]